MRIGRESLLGADDDFGELFFISNRPCRVDGFEKQFAEIIVKQARTARSRMERRGEGKWAGT